jgi:hypothetical protein
MLVQMAATGANIAAREMPSARKDDMADVHPAASEHLPPFITAPGATDVLMVVMGAVLLLAVLGFGILFLRLHSLPERIAHRSNKLQFEIVAVLCLIALFTHMHIFWIAALLLALIDLPDFGSSLGRMAGSLEKIADARSREELPEKSSETASASAEQKEVSLAQPRDMRPGAKNGNTPISQDAKIDPTLAKDDVHA